MGFDTFFLLPLSPPRIDIRTEVNKAKMLTRTVFRDLIKKRHFSSDLRTIKVCAVGSGPAGFYSSQYLLKHLPNCRVDLIEKLPVPFGLGNLLICIIYD